MSLAPLLGLGFTSSRQARDNRASAAIAETLISEAKEGTLTVGTGYVDNWGNSCGSVGAAYRIQTSLTPTSSSSTSGNLTRLKVQVVPLASPTRGQTYAVVFSPQ